VAHTLDLGRLCAPAVFPLGDVFSGNDPQGSSLSFTNCSMLLDGQPYFGVCGEIHYARISADQWEDTLIKAKMGGVNIVSTYVFWNVHEEVEGVFRFDGDRDLRSFVELCQKHGLWVILRVGPFAHGEMRNGGLPDWLYGKPYEVRSRDPGFLAAVKRLYAAIHAQVDGLYFSQGGPIIAAQLDNEFMHAGAPWEETSLTNAQYVPAGSGGEDYLRDLRSLLLEVGMVTPFYTCTAWGGAMAPIECALPLWGGYAYQPWLFYSPQLESHPPTEQYLYQDNHNNDVPQSRDFTPRYQPEDRPYACCEMMGGMSNSYRYRFQLPFESVDALANVKLGSGCTLLGYYMYRGGTTPTGQRTPFLNEGQTPKRTYDFQAPIGEFGQLRPSYHRLRLVHLLCQTFSQELCTARTVLPQNQPASPTDEEALRYCARVQGDRGFLFLNNFQDHFALPARREESITLVLPSGELTLTGLGLASGENAILPFNQELDGVLLRWASAQPIARIQGETGPLWFFFAPEGMEPSYALDPGCKVQGCETSLENGLLRCRPQPGSPSAFAVEGPQGTVTFVTLSREQALGFSKVSLETGDLALLSPTPLLWDGERLLAETDQPLVTAHVLGQGAGTLELCPGVQGKPDTLGNMVWQKLTFSTGLGQPEAIPAREVSPGRYTLDIPVQALTGCKTALLQLEYQGDVGSAFLDGELLSDNFANGAPWEIRVDSLCQKLAHSPLTVYITPIDPGSRVVREFPQAAQWESDTGRTGALHSALLRRVGQFPLLTL
jgi:hypothetical protein